MIRRPSENLWEKFADRAFWQTTAGTLSRRSILRVCCERRGWADPDTIEAGKGRHQWLLVQAIRLCCAKFGGCITEEDFDHAKTVLEDTCRYLRESPC